MNIQRKVVKITIEGKDYPAIMDFGAAIEFEMVTGKSIMNELQKLAEEQSAITLAHIMAATIKEDEETNKSVGLEFISKLDLMDGMIYYMEKMAELLDNGLIKEEVANNKKKRVNRPTPQVKK